MKRKTAWKCVVLLAGIASLHTHAAYSAGDTRPRPEDFSSYSLYLQALFDYQRQQNTQTAPTIANNSDVATRTENLDDAIANAGNNPGYVDRSGHPRSTFKSFALAPMPTQDMDQSSINDALGIFGGHALQQPPSTTARMRADSDLNLVPDVTLRLIGDAYDISMMNVDDTALESFSGRLTLAEGEAEGRASVQKSTQGDHGIDMSLSAKVRSSVYIIDRDGLPGTVHNKPGVVAIRPLAIAFSDMNSHITGGKNDNNQDVLAIQTSTDKPITIDFSGSRFGTSHTTDGRGTLAFDRGNIGGITNFAGFGDNAITTIAPGTKLDITLSHPEGMKKPLVTLNGKIPSLSLGNFQLFTQSQPGAEEKINIQIGKLTLSGLDISNLQVYIHKKTVTLDTGNGIRDMSIGMEQLVVGPDASAPIGDFYLDRISMPRSRISFSSH